LSLQNDADAMKELISYDLVGISELRIPSQLFDEVKYLKSCPSSQKPHHVYSSSVSDVPPSRSTLTFTVSLNPSAGSLQPVPSTSSIRPRPTRTLPTRKSLKRRLHRRAIKRSTTSTQSFPIT